MKVVIIGASGSLGRALASMEAKLKSELVLVASDVRDLGAMGTDVSLKHQVSVEVLALDLSNPDFAEKIPLDGDRYYFPIGMTLDLDQSSINSNAVQKIFQVNLHSVSAVISSLLRGVRSGPIELIGFGSIAETRGRSNNVYYSAAKRALTSFFESLLHGADTHNIRPFLFQIGYMKSQLSFGKKMLFPAADPGYVAEAVLWFVDKKKPGIYYLPGFWRWVCWALRFIPWGVYRRLRF